MIPSLVSISISQILGRNCNCINCISRIREPVISLTDINIVMETASCTREIAVDALIRNNNIVTDSILYIVN
jgi:hypothetical protein